MNTYNIYILIKSLIMTIQQGRSELKYSNQNLSTSTTIVYLLRYINVNYLFNNRSNNSNNNNSNNNNNTNNKNGLLVRLYQLYRRV